MGGSIWFDIFIIANVFIVGVLASIAFRHAKAHFQPHPEERQHLPNVSTIRISPEIRERLIKEAEDNFQHIVDQTASRLDAELEATSQKLGKTLDGLGSALLEDEMSRFKADITTLRQRTEATITQTEQTIQQHEQEIEASISEQRQALEASVAARVEELTAKRISEFDAKLADAVMAFLDETLQHNIDLGAQSDYLLAKLEEHKEEIKSGVTHA